MDAWKYILVTKKRDDESEYKKICYKKSSFSNLMKLRPIIEHKKYYEKLIQDSRTQAFTMTFNQELRDLRTEEQLRDLANDIMEFFPIKQYLLYPDIDINGNFHYHGVINMLTKDKPKMMRYTRIYSGFIKFRYITDSDKWYKYMSGEPLVMEEKQFNHPKERIYTDEEIIKYIVTSL